MTTQIAISLLAAAIPLTALILKFVGMVTPVQFVRLETEFTLFRDEVRRDLKAIRHALERQSNDSKKK
jgi:hypothetical protein